MQRIEQLELRRQVFDEPHVAKSTILALYVKNGLLWRAVAKEVGVSYETIWRWVKRLDLQAQVFKLQRKHVDVIKARLSEYGTKGGKKGGWPLGRPRKPKEKRS
jgi:transposase